MRSLGTLSTASTRSSTHLAAHYASYARTSSAMSDMSRNFSKNIETATRLLLYRRMKDFVLSPR